MSKIIGKIVGFFGVALIFYFLGKNLISNWGQIRDYQFSLNYFYLALSFVFLGIGFLNRGFVWKKILDILQPDNNLSYLEAVKIETYAELGKYLPGKIFSLFGLVYFARNKNISKKNLVLSVVFYSIFFIIAGFALSLFLISFFFTSKTDFLNFYLVGISVIVGGLAIVHPRLFQCLAKALIRVRGEPIELGPGLSWRKGLKIIFYSLFTHFFFGLGFFCFINSVTFLNWPNLLSIVGIYVLAMILGFVAFFTPGGLGIREGTLVLFLQVFLPLNVAILISLLARIWTTCADVLAAAGIYFTFKLKNV